MDLQTLFGDVAAYVQTVMAPQQLPAVVDRPFRIAASERTSPRADLSTDIQEIAYEAPEHDFQMVPGSLGYAAPTVTAPADGVRRARMDVAAIDRAAAGDPLARLTRRDAVAAAAA